MRRRCTRRQAGEKMQQRLQHLKGDTNPKHLDKVFAPDGGYMGKINSAVKLLQVWIEEESTLKQAPAIIQDRLIFGATNLTPMLQPSPERASLVRAVRRMRAGQRVAARL